MPWLQLEDDNLDLVTSTPATPVAKTMNPHPVDVPVPPASVAPALQVVGVGRERGEGEGGGERGGGGGGEECCRCSHLSSQYNCLV